MKSLIFLVALMFSATGLAQDKKASPFGAKKASDKMPETATSDAKPAATTATKPAAAAATKSAATAAAEAEAEDEAEAAKAASKARLADTLSDTIECKSGTDIRKLVTIGKDGGGCEVEYTKFGDTKVIGGAQYDKDVCVSVVAKVRATLETSGFSCN